MRITPVLILLALPSAVHSQITRDNYYSYVPAMSKLVTQTRASHALHLYGNSQDAAYADRDANGIDDRRQEQLHRIADRFSPVLRRNNFSFPRNIKRAIGANDVLMVDTWRVGQLVKSEEYRLGWSTASNADPAAADARLKAIVDEFDPLKTDARFIPAGHAEEKILFVDYPGSDPESWRVAYRDADRKEATIYTHFFIHEDSAARGPVRYYLVAQHWFFYPFNDAANNHEGDWEHMNVLITTRAAAEANDFGRLSEDQLQVILEGGDEAIRSLVIAFVDYSFHESIFTLSYLPAYRPATHAATANRVPQYAVWRDDGYVDRIVRERLAAGGGVLATHPVGYIGGNNTGPDELFSLWPRGSDAFNRNGHGNYAFPGTWQTVGPMASTERIGGRPVPALNEGPATDPLLERIADPMFVSFAKENIILVPDWERIHPLLATSDVARREWSWLVLPMRWGFPAAASPGGGAVPHADVGNISPEGPVFQPTWNHVGTLSGRRSYKPNVLRVVLAPTAPWDKLRSGWGVLNVPLGLLGFLPGWNVAATQLMPWVSGALEVVGAPPARTFRPEDKQLRFSSISVGMSHQSGGADFSRMLLDESSTRSPSGMTQSSESAVRFGLQVYYGPRFSIENSFVKTTRALASGLGNEAGFAFEQVTGTATVRELSGGVRYDVAQPAAGDVHLFVRGGWSWLWYDVENISRDGGMTTEANRNGGYAPTLWPSLYWWPNAWYGGAGVEYFAPRSGWVLPQIGYGLRAELTHSRHRLGATRPGRDNLGISGRSEVAVSAVIGW